MAHDRIAPLAGAVLALLCAALPLASLGMSHGERTPASGTGKSPAAVASSLSQGDRRFIEQAAEGGMAEVEMGQLAKQRAQNPKVKAFGQRMVHDHFRADRKLRGIASSKGVTIPAGLDRKSQEQYDRLEKLSGARFDREYMALMVSDHKKDVDDFRNEAHSAKDRDVKAFARAALPTLQEHLKIAEADRADIRPENPPGSNAGPAPGEGGKG